MISFRPRKGDAGQNERNKVLPRFDQVVSSAAKREKEPTSIEITDNFEQRERREQKNSVTTKIRSCPRGNHCRTKKTKQTTRNAIRSAKDAIHRTGRSREGRLRFPPRDTPEKST